MSSGVDERGVELSVPPENGVPQAGHCSRSMDAKPQTSQVRKRRCKTCQATNPATPSSKGRSRSVSVMPPSTSSNTRPAGIGASSTNTANTIQNHGKGRCISDSQLSSHPDRNRHRSPDQPVTTPTSQGTSQQKSHPLGWLSAHHRSETVVVMVGMNVLPGIDLFSQGATPQISSALQRFTAEFEMDRSGSTAPWTPG